MKRLLLLLAIFLMTLPSAHADSISFALGNANQYAGPAGTLSYVATVVAAAKNTGTVYLNGDSFIVAGTTFLDDSGFLFNFPLSLDPGQSYTGVLFTLTMPTSPVRSYAGSFSLLGGSDSNASGVLGTQAFAATVTPEPSSWILIATGLFCVAPLTRSRQTAGGFAGSAV